MPDPGLAVAQGGFYVAEVGLEGHACRARGRGPHRALRHGRLAPGKWSPCISLAT